VDTNEDSGRLSNKMIAQKAANLQQFRQTLQWLNQTHDRQTVLGKERVEPQRQHTRPADTGKLCLGKMLAQGHHQPRSEDIPGSLTYYDADTQTIRHPASYRTIPRDDDFKESIRVFRTLLVCAISSSSLIASSRVRPRR